MRRVLIVASTERGLIKTSTRRLIAKAKQLKRIVGVVLIGSKVELLAKTLTEYGADFQFIADDPSVGSFSPSSYSDCIIQAANKFSAEGIWFSSSENNKAIAPYVSSRLNTSCMTEIVDIVSIGNQDIFSKFVIAGKIIQKIQLQSHPYVIVVREGCFDVSDDISGKDQKTKLHYPGPDQKLRIKKNISSHRAEVDLADAKIIVAVGRGIEDQAGIDLVKGFASDLNAGLGATRALIDANLMPHNAQIGQTGKTVSPDLYIAIGLSGSVHHLAGMNNSKVVLAVNKDSNAPIFNSADYCIVGDLFEIIPILQRELKNHLT